MKRVDIGAYGVPEEVASCNEVADVGAPGPGEIVFDVLAFPINPADLSMIRGNYRLHPALPATPGAECVGRVAAAGSGVSDVRPGQLVINMARENWAQRRRIKAADALPIPDGLDLKQAAMLRINPATALLLLEDHVALKPGDWVIQDVANSAVGRHLIVLAKARGIRTINVVRRDDATDELHALGADVVLADGPDLAEHARDATGGAPIRLGIDAISGEACRQIADCLGDGAVMVNYGGLSGKDPEISRAALNGQAVTLTAFMRGRGLAKRTTAQVRALYEELAAELREGARNAPVDATYSIEDIKSALAHAQRRGRQGKVLVLPNGAI